MSNVRMSAGGILAGAGVFGAIIGVGSLALTEPGAQSVKAAARNVAVSAGWVRQRPPQPDDHWGGCNDARKAGTAPIFRGEPGYREDMDGDRDGIACEPIS